MAKRVQVSGDSGSTWHTLPGMTGDFNDEGDQIPDTIFGQTYSSTESGLITWTSSAQAFYKGFAGYVALIKSSGTSTEANGESMTLVAGKTFKITDATKNVWDHTKAVTVKDDGNEVDASNIESINYLFGEVTFVSGYTPTTPITVDVFYLPMTEVSKANSFTLTQTAETIDETDYATSRSNDGYRVFSPGLRQVSLELGGFYDSSKKFWEVLEDREPIVVEINPDGNGLSLCRGIFKMNSRGQSGDVGALEEETRSFMLNVPEDVDDVFKWRHDASSTLSQAIKVLLTAFESESKVKVRYAPDDLSGTTFVGDAVVTDISLSSSIDAMNEFTASFQGDGKPTRS